MNKEADCESPKSSAIISVENSEESTSPQPHCSYKPRGGTLSRYRFYLTSPTKQDDSDSDSDDLKNISIEPQVSKKYMCQRMLDNEELKLSLVNDVDAVETSHMMDHSYQSVCNCSDCEGSCESPDTLMLTELFRPAKTPLEIPYLLNWVFNFLPLKDMKNCRLVSREWRSSSLPQMRKYRLNITDQHRLECLVKYREVWDYNDDPGTFSNFELPHDVSLTDKNMKLFFEMYGPYIKELVIPNNGWRVDELQVILFNKLPVLEELKLIGDVPTDVEVRLVDGLDPGTKLIKLKRLFLHFTNAQERALPMVQAHGFFNSGTNAWTKRLVSDLLSVAPNLEVVRCSNKRDMMTNPAFCHRIARQVNRQTDEVALSFSCVNQFLAQKLFSRQHDSTPKLVNLDLYLRLNDRGMQKLEMKKYPLEALDIHVRYFDKQSLISLLRSLGKTLKFLRLRVDRQLILDFSFDFFTELETFHLEDYAGNLLFLGDMSKLKTLVLDKFEGRRFTRKENQTCFINSKITKLTLDSMRPLEMQGKCIKKLSVLLPNVRDFTLKQARDSDLLRIFDCMPQLEHLKLYSEKDAVTNSGLSGYTEADSQKILDAGYEFRRHAEYEGLRRLPYIGNLPNLKSLTLRGDLRGLTLEFMNQKMINSMHGLWILHGICNLQHLRNLSIQKAMLSSLELKELVNKMNLYRLELLDCEFDRQAMEKWIRRKTSGRPFEFVSRRSDTLVS